MGTADSVSAMLYDPFDPATQREPFPIYRRLRDEAPVHFVAGRGFWVLSRFEDVFRAVRDPETFSSAQGLTFEENEIVKLGLAPNIVMMDPPRQTIFRRLISAAFTPRQVTNLEPVVRAFVRDRLERIAAAEEADFIAELAGPLPTLVVGTYLGVPQVDQPRFDSWSNAIVQANAAGSVFEAGAAIADLYGYFSDLIDYRRAHPADDMLSTLLAAEVDGERLTTEEILGFCFVMIAGGNDTTTGMLGGAAMLLTDHPDQRARLLKDRGLIADSVEEFLRLTSPVQGLCRTTIREVTLQATTIPAGRKVHLLYAAANRDPREFGPDAEELDVTRQLSRILTFGHGPHYCLGAAAARLQGRVTLEELLGRFPDFAADHDRARYAPGPFVRRFESLPIRVRR